MGYKTRIDTDHYKTLGISEGASQRQIKQAYRKLAKQFHPDSQNKGATTDKIALVNAAYEVLGDMQARQQYDIERQLLAKEKLRDRTSRAVDSQAQYRQRRKRTTNDATIEQWLRGVFNPVDRLMGKIIKPLKAEVRALSADPFDDELMATFQTYLE
ncbi:MAG: DnaJ domain-containing protein, partial [Phormidesmis sp.]